MKVYPPYAGEATTPRCVTIREESHRGPAIDCSFCGGTGHDYTTCMALWQNGPRTSRAAPTAMYRGVPRSTVQISEISDTRRVWR